MTDAAWFSSTDLAETKTEDAVRTPKTPPPAPEPVLMGDILCAQNDIPVFLHRWWAAEDSKD